MTSYNGESTGLTANCNNELTSSTTVCVGQTTKYNDETRGRTDRQSMIPNDRLKIRPWRSRRIGGTRWRWERSTSLRRRRPGGWRSSGPRPRPGPGPDRLILFLFLCLCLFLLFFFFWREGDRRLGSSTLTAGFCVARMDAGRGQGSGKSVGAGRRCQSISLFVVILYLISRYMQPKGL